MKKKLLAVLLTAVMVLSFTACGEKEEDGNSDNTNSEDMFVLSEENLDKYITLNDNYDVFDVEISAINVTDEQVNQEINNLILDNTAYSDRLKTMVTRAAEAGDIVNIDYVGTKDGVAFDGGTSYTSTNLELGSGGFIDGFEDGLIGKKAGDVVTLDLTFPENYTSAELAGQAVQFEVTIHYIVPTYNDITDEDVPSLYEGYNTMDELRTVVKQDIYDSLYTQYVEYAVIEQMESKCTYADELPQYLTDVSYNNIMENLETYAYYNNMDLETYIYLSYFQDLETFQNETAWQLAESNTRYLLYCQAYANEKDLNVTEEELNAQLTEYVEYYGMESIEAGFTDEEIDSIKNSMMNMKVLDYIIENANVTIADETVAQ